MSPVKTGSLRFSPRFCSNMARVTRSPWCLHVPREARHDAIMFHVHSVQRLVDFVLPAARLKAPSGEPRRFRA